MAGSGCGSFHGTHAARDRDLPTVFPALARAAALLQRRRRPDGERWSVQQPRIRAVWSEPRVALRGEGEKASVQRRHRPALVPQFPRPCHCPPPVKGRWGQRGPTVRSGSWWPQVQVRASCVTLGESLPLSESCPQNQSRISACPL